MTTSADQLRTTRAAVIALFDRPDGPDTIILRGEDSTTDQDRVM